MRVVGVCKFDGQQGRAGPDGSRACAILHLPHVLSLLLNLRDQQVRWSAGCTRLFILLEFYCCRRAQEINRFGGQQGNPIPAVSLLVPCSYVSPSTSRDLSTQRRLLTEVPPSQRKSRDRQPGGNLQASISVTTCKSVLLVIWFCPMRNGINNLLTGSELEIMDSQNSSLGTKRKLFIAPGSLARGRGKNTRHLGLSGQNHVSRSIEHEPSLVNTYNNDMQCVSEQVDHVEDSQAQMESSQDKSSTQQNLNKRGKNKCGTVCKLKNGEKLLINFYMGRAVGLNHQAFTRHLGIIVRDGNICPVRVLAWNKIGEDAKNHMWAAVTDKFKNDDIELYREATLKHMQQLWKNWRCEMNSKFVKPCKTRQEVLQNVPKGMDKQDWEWLVKEYFLSESFQKMSKTNTQNRSLKSMPHRTGSKPFRQLAYEMGGKDGQPPDFASMFFETRKKGDHIVDLDAIEKYDEICEVVREDSSLSNIQLVEKCFGPQRHDHVFGHGGGVRPKDVRGPIASKQELHHENVTLREKMNNMESEFKAFKELMLKNLPPNAQVNASASNTIEGAQAIGEEQ
ncbi:hypothetical protein ZIOFF_060271 [Zingiber officinale]|uniref:Uncharacterized protein n=1 Tax=Zingiber officinale TaxID=94328 RepID=A0A8J5FGG6_ZINOF|nr:hypothetical protein ZIOFF_060271 [Zingiber officinale]